MVLPFPAKPWRHRSAPPTPFRRWALTPRSPRASRTPWHRCVTRFRSATPRTPTGRRTVPATICSTPSWGNPSPHSPELSPTLTEIVLLCYKYFFQHKLKFSWWNACNFGWFIDWLKSICSCRQYFSHLLAVSNDLKKNSGVKLYSKSEKRLGRKE